MRAVTKVINLGFIIIFLLLSITAIGQAAVESVGEINAKDNDSGTIIAGTQTDLIVAMTIDMSQAEPGEEIESIRVTVPNGIGIDKGTVKSVTMGENKIPNFTETVQDNLIIVTLPTVITLTSRVYIEFRVDAPQIPVPRLPFIVSLIAIRQRLLIASIKPGNADGRVNNDSLTLKAVSATKPPTPSNVNVQPDPEGENDLIILWTKVDDDGVSGYLIFRDSGDEPVGNVIGVAGTSYTDKDLNPGSYTYTVRSYKTSTLRSDPSAPAVGTVTADTKAPIPPKIDLEPKSTDKGIEILWEPSPSGDVAKYFIYRGASENSASKIDEVASTESSYIDKNPPESGSYLYVVSAVDEAGNEGKSSATQSRYVISGNKPQPNPFTPLSTDPRFNQIIFPITMIKEGEGTFMIKIYDLSGSLVFEMDAPEGSREIKWDGKDMGGRVVDSGVYVYQATIGNKNKIGSIVVAK